MIEGFLTDLFAARAQMAVSLAFHIVFASIGMGLPVLIVFSEWQWLRTDRKVYRRITRAWAKALAIFFAVGAVSGTVLSFELGLLWPEFMEVAGPLIGLPFSLEGFAFFTEAIFLGIYLYGWGRVPPKAHLAAAIMVALSGTASALFVLSVNGWMNAPTGFDPSAGEFSIDPIAAMANPFWLANTAHMVLAAYTATGFGVAGIHAWRLRSDPQNEYHRKALRIALSFAAVTALLQPLSGDVTARVVAEHQPVKLAAMEAHFETKACSPLILGGIPDEEAREVRWGLEIPCGLSLLTERDPGAVVQGLEEFPEELWPPVTVVHLAFQVMVAIGTFLAAIGAWGLFGMWRKKSIHESRFYLLLLMAAGPLAFVAIQAGWVVTEVGRQPWIIYGIMKTSEAVTPMPGLIVPFTVFTGLYMLLTVVVVLLLLRLARSEGPAGGAGGDGAVAEAGRP